MESDSEYLSSQPGSPSDIDLCDSDSLDNLTFSNNITTNADAVLERVIPDLARCRSYVYSAFTWVENLRLWICNECG